MKKNGLRLFSVVSRFKRAKHQTAKICVFYDIILLHKSTLAPQEFHLLNNDGTKL